MCVCVYLLFPTFTHSIARTSDEYKTSDEKEILNPNTSHKVVGLNHNLFQELVLSLFCFN